MSKVVLQNVESLRDRVAELEALGARWIKHAERLEATATSGRPGRQRNDCYTKATTLRICARELKE